MPTESTGQLAPLEAPWPDVVRHTHADVSVDVAVQGFRNLAVDGRVVVSALYPAVRAADWSTLDLGPAVDSVEGRPGSRRFTRHQHEGERFHATTTLELNADAAMVLRYELRPLGREEVNRWGLNVCLDAAAWRGAPVTVDQDEHLLPTDISPQRAVGGRPEAMFAPAAALDLVHPAGALGVSSAGPVLELEDQRNWTDPTFKIYGGSLRDPRPIVLEAGERYVQTLRLTWRPTAPSPVHHAIPPPVVGAARELPRVGVQLNELPADPSLDIAAVLGDLGVDHVRLDVERTHAGRTLSRLPPVPVELAVLARGDGEHEAEGLADLVPRAAAAVRVLWHLDGRRTTGATEAAAVRSRLPDPAAVEVVPGTDAYFVDLNRDRPDTGRWVSFSISPTVHTDDSETVFATLAAQAEVVRQARTLFGGAVVVSPVTWTIRGAPELHHDAAHRAAGSRPDARVATLEGAAWTLGSVHALLSAAAASGTWHELFGTNGLIEIDGSATPGCTPAFHALAALQAATRPSVRAVGRPGSPWVGVRLVDLGALVVASLRPWTQLVDPADLPGELLSRRRLRNEDVARARLTRRWWDVAAQSAVDATRPVTLEPFEISVFDEAP